MKNKLAILIPVHELNETTNELLSAAFDSAFAQTPLVDVYVVSPETVTFTRKNVKVIVNTGETDFCSQINFAAKELESKYEFFSILELDDTLSHSYVKTVLEYIEAYPKVGVFLPIINQVNEDGEFLGFSNEAPWADNFGEKIGYLDLPALMEFESFSTSGGVFNIEKFNEAGGYKTNIKLHFMYELLLRLVNEDVTIMSLPKILYTHVNLRKDSLFASYRDPIKGITPEEAYFYLETAKKEYFFNPLINREIKFVPSQVAI